LSVQKTTSGTGSRRPKAWSVLQLHGVSVWRGHGFGGLKAAIWSLFLDVQKQTLGTGSRKPKAWARPRFWRLEGCNLESVQKETLGTRNRRQDARASNGRKQEAKEQEASKHEAR